MKLGVNGWRLRGPTTGIVRYLVNLLRHWTPEMVGDRFEQINFYCPRPVDRKENPLPASICERVVGPDCRLLLWENLALAAAARDDVLFCPSYTRPLFSRCRTVVTTHDATSQIFPQLFPRSVRLFYNRLYGWSAREATLVITDSEAGRQDIARFWHVSLDRIRVVHLAPEEIFRRPPGDATRRAVAERIIGFDGPFFVYVGKLSGRRSTSLLLEGFAEFKRRAQSPHKLLAIGLNVHGLDVSGMIQQLGLSSAVRYWQHVSDEELNAIYHQAEALVSPSIYETVCLPVMEAQAAGLPVICPDTAGMQELTGAGALRLSRPEVDVMADAMTRLSRDKAFRSELAEASRESAQRFSWERCAGETLEVLEEAARSTP